MYKTKQLNFHVIYLHSMFLQLADVQLKEGKKIYFASDFHFGIPDYEQTRKREVIVCSWLDAIKSDAQQIYLVGDIFDSWMEYKLVVPKGTVRFLGKLAEIADAGIEIIVFTGNHDLWMHGYFEQELGIKVIKTAQSFKINDQLFHVAHGDGVCSKEWKYILLKKLLHSTWSQFIYSKLHPDLGLRLADWFSRLGPKHKYVDLGMKDHAEEYQILYAKSCLLKKEFNYFIFGHRHIPLKLQLNDSSTFINLGDWISYNTYAVFDGKKVILEKY